MQKLKLAFSYSVAKEIMPELSFSKNNSRHTKFALILSTGESISISEIEDIKKRTSLTPVFFDVFLGFHSELLRSYARSLGATIVKVQTKKDFADALKECSFTVTEEITGALFSFLSHTPAYIDAGNYECRNFIGETTKWNISSEIIMPYTKNRTAIIHRPTASDEDFSLAIKKFRADIDAKFQSVFF